MYRREIWLGATMQTWSEWDSLGVCWVICQWLLRCESPQVVVIRRWDGEIVRQW